MPGPNASFIDFKFWNTAKVQSLFAKAREIESHWFSGRPVGADSLRPGGTAALLFFEASTRTRMSFETACHRLGLGPLVLDTGGGTSLEKGETVEDSILNIAAMNPLVVIVRCGNAVDLEGMTKLIPMPIVNAGWGWKGHPTQALLDAYTLQKTWGSCAGKKVLIVGDIRHSRVAASHFHLAPLLGYEVAVAGPAPLLGDLPAGTRSFSNFDEGLRWCDAVMMLRFQFERHTGDVQLQPEEIKRNFGLHASRLPTVPKDALILHPGPVNHGVEMDSAALADSRCRVLQQVTSGVFVRQALLHTMIEGKS